jgi:hypothetical protein
MTGALVARPSDNVTSTASLAWSGTSADTSYPIANLKTLEPDVVAKSTSGGSVSLVATIAATALKGFALINTNLRGLTLTLTNSGGMTAQPTVVPSPDDGLCCNVYWDLRGLSGTTASTWTVAIAGAPSPVAIGTLLMLADWTLVRVRWDWELVDVFPRIEQRTSYGKRLQYQIPVRTRKYAALAIDATQRNFLREVAREAHGSIVPWTLVPDVDDDAVMLVQFVEDHRSETYRIGHGKFRDGTAVGLVDQPIAVEEVNGGVAL